MWYCQICRAELEDPYVVGDRKFCPECGCRVLGIMTRAEAIESYGKEKVEDVAASVEKEVPRRD